MGTGQDPLKTTDIKTIFHYGHGGQLWASARKFPTPSIAQTFHNFWVWVFAGFSFENLVTRRDAKSVLTLKLLRQKLSQILPACSPAVQVSAIWLRITWNHAVSWSCYWLDMHAEPAYVQRFQPAASCQIYPFLVSRCCKFTFLQTQKETGCHSFLHTPKSEAADCSWPAWPAVTLACLYVPGCIAWSSLTLCSTVVPSTFVKTWVKANLRGPSTMSPWLHGLAHCATCGIRKTGFQSSETWMCQDKGNVSFALNAMVFKQILMMVVHLHWKEHAAVYNLKFVGVSVSVPK